MIEVDVAAPVDEVWRAWTVANELTTWLSEQAVVEAEPGGAFELFWDPENPEINSTLGCTITDLSEHRYLEFNWKGPSPFADLMNAQPYPTSVTVYFEPTGPRRTRVRLEHVGWQAGPRWEQARRWHEEVWRNALATLQRNMTP